MKSADDIFNSLRDLGSWLDNTGVSVRLVASTENTKKVELFFSAPEVSHYAYCVVTVCIPCARLFGKRVIYGKDIITKEIEDYLMSKASKYTSNDALAKKIKRIKEMRGLWNRKRMISVSLRFEFFATTDTVDGPMGRMFLAPLEDAAKRALLRLEKEREDEKISFILVKNCASVMSLSGVRSLTEADIILMMKEDGSGLTYPEDILASLIEFVFSPENVTGLSITNTARISDIGKKLRTSRGKMHYTKMDAEREEFWERVIKPFLSYFLEEIGTRPRT